MSDNGAKPQDPEREENDSERLRRSTTAEVVSVELVSAFAGDREMTAVEKRLIDSQKRSRGKVFFSDLLYAISHHYFAPEIAAALWDKILAHKEHISRQLDRNVRITVATLDYLSNVTSELPTPTLISESYVSKIASLAMRDGMTGLFNHSTCYELLELELKNHRRYGIGVAFLLLDVDEFKAVNDREGHQAGDRILIEIANTLTAQARDSDICCRLGGDEFGVILRLTNDSGEACEIAERIRKHAERVTVKEQPITISVGVALCNHLTTCAGALIESADRALREAKVGGKNQVVLDVAR